jgi:hypothetical protein
MRRAAAILAGAVAVLACAAPAHAFTPRVTNHWYPLLPGMKWVYVGREDGQSARDVVRVLDRVKMIDGVPCAVVRDKVFRNGKLRERTTDWYTQDDRGRVWYYGEATAELDRHGKVVSREGSWRAGRDGARAGIFMPRRPRVGQRFQQEHFPGHAEDHFAVLTLHASIATPFASYDGDVLKTKEWTPLEPGVRDRKYYVRGIGQVAERTVKGGTDDLRLAAFRDS